jgi:hypothetical protein
VSFRWSLCTVTLMAGFAAAAPATHVQGILIDQLCSYKAQPHIVSGPRLEGGMIVAEAHERTCDLKPACQRSGYGVFTYDEKFLKFDKAGDRKALAMLRASKKDDDLKVEVTGEVKGNTIKVASLKFIN